MTREAHPEIPWAEMIGMRIRSSDRRIDLKTAHARVPCLIEAVQVSAMTAFGGSKMSLDETFRSGYNLLTRELPERWRFD